MKKIIIYLKNKSSNNIKSIIERQNPILNLKDDEGYVVIDSSIRVDIIKDKVVDGILCKYREESVRTNNFDSAFPKYKNSIGLIYSHEKECGITNYSNDLINNSLNNFTRFVNRESNIEESDKIIKSWSIHDKDYNELFEKIIESKVEVVHFQYNHGIVNVVALKHLAKKLNRADIFSIITLHSVSGGVSIFKDYFDIIVVHSESCKKELMLEKVPEEKIKIVNIGSFKYNDTSVNKFELRQSLGFNPTDKLIFNFGFLLPHKGVDILIDAFNDISYDFENAKLVVLGSVDNVQHKNDSSKYFEKLKEQVKRYGIEDKVIFNTDFLDLEKIQQYLYCADLIVLPYRHSASQGASSTLRTALSVCKPVIVSDIPLFDDLKGILKFCKANNKIDLKNTILDVLENPCKEMESKIDAFIKKTSWKKVGVQHSKIYRAFSDLKIHINGQFFSYQSTSQINRGLAESLDQLGVDVSLESVNMAENKNYVFSEKFTHLIGDKNKSEICVRNYYPPKFDEWGDSKIKIQYLPAETTSISEEWIKGINDNNIIIWTYSQHCKDVMIDSGVKKPILIMPPGYNPDHFNIDVEKIDWNSYKDSYTKEAVFPPVNDKTFVFMFIGASQFRKGTDILLKSIYSGKFTNEDNLIFIIKSYSTGEIHNDILKAQQECQLPIEQRPRLLYLYSDDTPEMIPRMYCSANLLVMPSRAEGYLWCALEAMSCGIPTLTTNFGGCLQFADNDTTYLLDGEMKPSTYHEQGLESFWCEIDSDILADKIYDIYQKGINDKEYQDKVNNGLIRCMDFTWDEISLKVIEFLKGLK